MFLKIGKDEDNMILEIKSPFTSRGRQFTSIKGAEFTANSKNVLLETINDSLFLLNLKESTLEFIAQVKSFALSGNKDEEWVGFVNKADDNFVIKNIASGKQISFQSVGLYLFNRQGLNLSMVRETNGGLKKELLVYDLFTNKIIRQQNILFYSFGISGNEMVYEYSGTQEGQEKNYLNLLNFSNDSIINVWSGDKDQSISRVAFGHADGQVAFVMKKSDGSGTLSCVYYFRIGMESAIVKSVNDNISDSKSFDNVFEFSGDGKWLFFTLSKIQNRGISNISASPNIWTYRDRILNPQQRNSANFQTICSIGTQPGAKVVEILDSEEGLKTKVLDNIDGDYIVIGDHNEENRWWPPSKGYPSYWLVSLNDGTRTLIKKNCKAPLTNFCFSPTGKWLVFWDCEEKAWMSFDLRQSKCQNLSKNLPPMDIEEDVIASFENSIFSYPVEEVAGWFENDMAFMAYDRYDLWKVDPSGERKPVNLTGGYGQQHHVKLRLVKERRHQRLYNGNDSVLLTGFNTSNKYSGFFKANINKPGAPTFLSMGPYKYTLYDEFLTEDNENNYRIVQRRSSSEFPNFYMTKDLKEFKPLTEYEPQKRYNWLTAELISWKQLDGSNTQGILYKPENFDPKRKYPVIFNYYESLSQGLHEFLMPEITTDNINIPWFVSRGYLVVTPDIHFSVASKRNGKLPGESACNAVVSAARYVGRLPYVDSTKMAIQGHSFGGGETNFIITHSNIFAAACSASATVSDEISAYLGLIKTGKEGPRAYRINHTNGHDMIGATLWERPDLYIKASPVFKADRVNTPLLMMQCQGDDGWEQGSEFYMALRRLGKRVWMLDYDGEGHSLLKRKNALDFTIRLTQFLDHFLKGDPPPKWMTQSQFQYSGLKEGLELDRSGAIP